MRLQASYALVKRLAVFLPAELSASRNNFRITAAGTPMGLVLGTSSFLKATGVEIHPRRERTHACSSRSSYLYDSIVSQVSFRVFGFVGALVKSFQ